MSTLLKTLTKVLPLAQAKSELKWIKLELPENQWEKAVQERAQFKPLQYILGSQPFGKLDIRCKEGVLIPRAETEEWVTDLAGWLDNTLPVKNVLDYGSGSGCIALLLASLPTRLGQIYGVDKSLDAVSLAQENKLINKTILGQALERVHFFQGDLFKQSLPEEQNRFELLVSNPPYIPEKDMNEAGGVEPSVLKYEPRDALVGDTEYYQKLVELLPKIDANAFVFEVGYPGQASFTRQLLPKEWHCGLRHDSAGHARNVVGWKDAKFDCLEDMIDEPLK